MLRILAFLLLILFSQSGYCCPVADQSLSGSDRLLARSIATANVTTTVNNSSVNFQTTPLIKAVCTTLAGFALILAVLTYWILIRYAAPMTRGVSLPWSAIETNVSKVLTRSWIHDLDNTLHDPSQPNQDDSEGTGPTIACGFKLDNWMAIKPLSMPDSTEIMARRARGIKNMIESTSEVTRLRTQDTMIWMNVGSSAAKSLVQLTIWEAISFWLACLMVINTVVYNGFATGHRSSDGNLRLFLVATYAFLQILFSAYTTYIQGKIYGYFIEQASWVILTNLLSFANKDEQEWWRKEHLRRNDNAITISNYDKKRPAYDNFGYKIQYPDRGLILKRYRMVLLGEWTIAETLGSVFTKCNPGVGTRRVVDSLYHRYNVFVNSEAEQEITTEEHREHDTAIPVDSGKVYFKRVQLEESAIEKTIKSTRESEIKNLEKTLETGLEKALAHAGVLLGILLSTGIAPYTSIEFEKSNAVQLGSYALLLAVATGITALFSSLTSLTSAQESLKVLHGLQKQFIEVLDVEDQLSAETYLWRFLGMRLSSTHKKNHAPSISLSLSDVFRDTHGLRRWGCFVFGRGLAFLPSKRQSGTELYWSRPLVFKDAKMQFNTAGDLGILRTKNPVKKESVEVRRQEWHEMTDIEPRKTSSMREIQSPPAINKETASRRRSV